MIIGVFGKDGSAVVMPMNDLLNASGLSEYAVRQALEGKGKIKGQIVVKMPNNTPLRPPEGDWKVNA